MKKITRRQFLTATGVLAATGAMAACSGGSTGGAGAASTATSTATSTSTDAAPEVDTSMYEVTEPITITWWHALETQYDELVASIVDGFNASQDLVTVEALYVGSYTDTNEALVAAHAAGTGLPGVVVANTDYVASYGSSGLFEALEGYIAATEYDIDDFAAGLVVSSQCDGKQVALPFLHSTQVIYYNKDIANELGVTVPESMADFSQFLADVSVVSESGETTRYGTIIPGWDQWYFETMFLNDGVEIITADNTCDLNSEASMARINEIQDWCESGYAYWASGTDASSTMRQNFYDGKAFSVMHTSSLYNNYVDNCDFEVGMAWYPASALTGDKNSEVGGCVLGIPAKNDQATKNASWQFLQYLCGKEVNMQWAIGTGYIPTRNSVLQTEEGVAFLEEKPAFKAIFDNLDLILPRIQSTAWSELKTTWKSYMDIILCEFGDPTENADAMTEEINAILEDYE